MRMSIVPIILRNFWHDHNAPFRAMRMLDQHFNRNVREYDNLFSSFWDQASPLTSGYLRPWKAVNWNDLEDMSTRMKFDKNQLQIQIDVEQFSPSELTVKTDEKHIIVEGKHEDKEDEHGYVSRHFIRRYPLPDDSNPDDIHSSLSSDGVLTISVARKAIEESKTERVIPITQSGENTKENTKELKSGKEESSSSTAT